MIVLHVGLRKAGSTSIQHFLSTNEAALRGLGVEYPQIGRRGRVDHNSLATELRGIAKFDAKYGTLAELAAFWRQSPAQTLMLSGESFEECNLEQCARLKTTLDRGNDDFRVVLILRDLVDLMMSSFAQKIKHGRYSYDFDEFYQQRMDQRRVTYARTAKIWAKVFGWENLRVRLLDRQALVNGDLIDDFLTTLGFDPGSAAVADLVRPGSVNVSPGWRVLEALRALYRQPSGLPERHPLVDCPGLSIGKRRVLAANALQLGDKFDWNKDRGNYMTYEQAEECLEINRASIEKLNRKLPHPLPLPRNLQDRGFAPRDLMPDAGLIAPGELLDFYDQLGAMALTWRSGVL